MDKSGGPLFSIGYFFSNGAKKYRVGTICFRKFLVQKKLNMDQKRGGGYHVLSSEFFSLTSPKNIVGNHSMFQEDSAMRKIMDKRKGTPFFPSEIICLRVPKKIVGEPFGVTENLGYRKKFMDKKGEGRSFTISIGIFQSHSSENIREGNIYFRKILLQENNYG